MKPRVSNQKTAAMTLTEVLVIIVVLVVLLAVIFPALNHHSGRAQKIDCVNNLKQVGLAPRIWAEDHGGKYPMQVSVTNGGASELIATGNVVATFQVLSNELSNPKILWCPQDTRNVRATNFTTDFSNDKISYFVGPDTDINNSQAFLTGDDDFAIRGAPLKSGLAELASNSPIAWDSARHVPSNPRFWMNPRKKSVGYIGMGDGSVQELNAYGLQQALLQTSFVTNRLAIP